MTRENVEIIKSDLSGKTVEPGDTARIVVSDHPALGTRVVELDADVTEAERLEASKLSIVSVAVYLPGQTIPRRVIMDAAAFDKHFDGDVSAVLLAARPGGGAPGQRPRGRPSAARGAATARMEKVDYTDPSHFGQLHRGRITETEAELVRGDPAQASMNRQVQGHPPINWDDDAEKGRYGL
jgi:hypothetical protein